MLCKNCNTNSFDYYFIGQILIIRCLECSTEFTEEEIDFTYWEEEDDDKTINPKLDRRTKKAKDMLGL